MGLLRGIARTAAIAGTATAVSNRVSRRQANRWAAKDQQAQEEQYAQQPPPEQYAQPQYAPPPQQYAPAPQYAQPQYAEAPAPAESLSTDDMLDQLKKLGELKESGVLTQEEFEASKAKILGS
jgi:hypothetical protein